MRICRNRDASPALLYFDRAGWLLGLSGRPDNPRLGPILQPYGYHQLSGSGSRLNDLRLTAHHGDTACLRLSAS